MALRRTPLKGGKPLTRKTPLRNKPREHRDTAEAPNKGEVSGASTPDDNEALTGDRYLPSTLRRGGSTVGQTSDVSRTPPLDLTAAARALARQAESAAAPRREHAPVPEVSKPTPKPSSTGFPMVVRQTILDRDAYTCWRCGRDVTAVGYNLQHRDNRGRGGTRDPRINWPSNGIVLCGSATTGCHGWVEHNGLAAEKLGWAVQSWADPESVPVYHAAHGWMLVTRRGTRHLCAEPTNADAHTVARRKEPLR